MSRKHIYIAASLGLVIAALLIWRPWSGSEKSTGDDTVADGKTPKLRKKADSRDFSSTFDVLADDDAIGTLRLEGRVIDDTEDGVAGAIVTVSSNPPRTATTEEDGSFFFDKLVGRSYRLVARSPVGAASPVVARLTATSGPVTLHVRPSSKIEVTVLTAAERKPVPGATVELRGALRDRATADGDGVARLSSVPAGRYQIAGWSTGNATARSFMRIGNGASTYKLELLLAAGSSVSGRVLDEDGAPVAGARVLYASVSERRDRAHPLLDGVVTEENGAFSFPALPKGTWRILARHKTLAPGSSEPVTLDGATKVDGVEIRLEAGAALRGRVVDADGAPAPGAVVRASVGGRGFRGRRPRQTYADDDGKFELEGLPKAAMSVVALHESASSETQAVNTEDKAEATSLVLKLALTGRIAGTVIDSAGEPVDGAQVRLMPDFRAGAGRRFNRQEFRLRGISTELTDPGGNFEFRGLSDMPYRVSASPPGSQRRGRGPMSGGEEASVGELDVEIVLEARGTIVGKVAFANGDPPAAFTVSTGGRRAAPIPFTTEDGSFELTDLEPRGYRLSINGPSFDGKTISGVQVVAGDVIDVGTIAVKQGRRVSGRVTDSGGSPVENATVVVGARLRGSGQSTSGSSGRPFNAGSSKETTTDSNGEFSLSGVGERELALVAEHPSKGRSVAISLPRTSKSSLGLAVVLEPPGALAGTVTINGAASGSIRVTAQSKTATSARFTVVTGDDGRYRFDVLAPDTYLISASVGPGRRGFGQISKTIAISSGKTSEFDVRFTGGELSLSVAASGPEDGLGTGFVQLVDADVTATTPVELEAFLSSREGGFAARGMIMAGEPTKFDGLKEGAYTACITALPDEVFGRQAFEYIGREGESLLLSCSKVNLEGTGERSMTIPVVVPEFVPPPKE